MTKKRMIKLILISILIIIFVINLAPLSRKNEEHYGARAFAYLEKGDLDKSLALYEKILNINQNNIDARMQISFIYETKGLKEKAQEQVLIVLNQNPNYIYAYELLFRLTNNREEILYLLEKSNIEVDNHILDRIKYGYFLHKVIDINSNKIIEAARYYIAKKPTYEANTIYDEGYPPEHYGACTDLIWRVLKYCNYDLKNTLDEDIRNNRHRYSIDIPDPRIDFRRVRNLVPFFEAYINEIPVKLENGFIQNYSVLQKGDFVIFSNPDHIGIISDEVDQNGIPLVIHHPGGDIIIINDELLSTKRDVVRVFRWNY